MKLLHIDSSPMGEYSMSCRLTKEFARRWARSHPHAEVIYRDLTRLDIPVIDAVWIMANQTPKKSRTEEQNKVLKLSSKFTSDLFEADEYIIGVPTHNRGPSASFKLWMDQIVRFEETLILTPTGPRGALTDKRATFVVSSGRAYGPDSADASNDLVEGWLRNMFGYLGVRDMRFIIADGTKAVQTGNIDLASYLAPRIRAIEALFAGREEPIDGRYLATHREEESFRAEAQSMA
ncbi:MAG TPA: NAD(P)H-dependent oxidoreductase [Blastocatellia bacterium]